ncbi:myrosinase 1-like [Cydia fagiglandana]|uniref:myrosinase 1-like n=1 Tax=Cydia fagiglandana TaxID=1458189 RepID=UPI002FEE149A
MSSRAVLIVLALTRTLEVACLKTFPPGFRFGAASAAYQIEGGWNASDKGESVWDRIVHTRPDFIADRSTGDEACDSYHLWEEDLKILEELGVDFYRFSISWPRLLPSGFTNRISEDGCRYYSDLIDGLLARGIAPVVTLYHWDLPQNLQDLGTWLPLYYSDLIDGLLARGIAPVVTLYHWDLSQNLQALGGWTNPLVVEWFADYARVVFALFADRVHTWITINEPCFVCDGAYRDMIAPGLKVKLFLDTYITWTNPLVVRWFADYARVVFALFAGRVRTWITVNEPCFVCDGAYRDMIAPGLKVKLFLDTYISWTNPLVVRWFADYARVVFALFAGRVNTWITINEPCFVCDGAYRDMISPGLKDHEIGALLCTKYVLLAHAAAYRIYDEEYKHKYGGEVSITNQEFWLEPKTEADLELMLLAREYAFGRYTYPIYSAEGGWPPALEAYMALKSEKEGYPRSRLPPLTPEEIQLIKGSFDFFALNHYTSRTVRALTPGEQPGQYMFESVEEVGAVLEGREQWPSDGSGWLRVNPEGFRQNLNLTRQLYGDVRVLITENGCSSDDTLNDTGRVHYIHDYLEQVLLAIEDGVNVVGYTAWSLMDDFEWVDGYQTRFGLHAVNFTDPRRTRTAKASAKYYRDVIRSRSLRADHDIKL